MFQLAQSCEYGEIRIKNKRRRGQNRKIPLKNVRNYEILIHFGALTLGVTNEFSGGWSYAMVLN